MKHWITVTIVCVWLIGFAFGAQTSSPPEIGVRIAFVDTLGVLQQTEEGRQEIARIEQLVTQKQQDLQSQSAELQQLRERFLSQGQALNPETRAEMQRSIEEKERHVRRMQEDLEYDVNRRQNDLVNRMRDKILQVIAEYAEANGFSAVFTLDPSLPFVAETLDITGDVIQLYNQKHGSAASGPPSPANPFP